MSAPPELRVGVIGYGVMGKAHCYAYRVAPMLRRLPVTPVVSVISGRNEQAVTAAAAAYGVPEHTTDWRGIIARDDIAVVDICTPPGTHAEIAAAAAAAGKAVLCEKPLAVTYAGPAAALAAVTAAGVPNAVSFNYRRLPAVSLMRRMIAEGRSGTAAVARHLALRRVHRPGDAVRLEVRPGDGRDHHRRPGLPPHRPGDGGGGIRAVCAQAETFIRSLRLPGGGTRDVTVDDAASALLRFDTGAIGTMEVARAAVRRPCDFTIEANGSEGTLVFDYARLNELRYGRAGTTPACTACADSRGHPSHPYAADWWPLGQGVGYGSSFVNQAADLLEGWPGAEWTPGFADGVAAQAVCAAIETSAAQDRG